MTSHDPSCEPSCDPSSDRSPDSTSPNVGAAGSTLLDLSKRGDQYLILSGALAHLENNPDDAAVALLACRAYAALGLIGPARDLATSPGGGLGATPEGRAIAERIARTPSGRVAWSSLQKRFDGNVARLYERYPSLRVHDKVFRSIPRTLELYRTSDDQWQVATRLRAGAGAGVRSAVRRWLPDLRNAKKLAAEVQLGHDPAALFCGPYLVMADRFGLLLDRVYEGTEKMFLTFSPRIYLVEPDPLLLGVTLFISESIDRYCDERVSLFVGSNAAEELLDFLRRRQDRTLPEFLLCGRSPSWLPFQQACDAIRSQGESRAREALETFAGVEGYYASLPDDHWKRRFESGEPLRVLGFTSRFTTYLQYSMRDCKAAFERLGHRFELLIEQNDHDLLPSNRNAQAVAALKPDLIFVIDHLRYEFPYTLPANVPFVCWIQDQLPNLTSKQAGQSLGPLDYCIAPEVDQFVRHYDYPSDQGMRWTMATNDRLYSAERLSDPKLAPYRCDISFVSNQSKLPRVFHAERLKMLPDSDDVRLLAEHLFQAIEREMIERPGTAGVRSAMTLLEKMQQEIGVSLPTLQIKDAMTRFYIHPLTELMYRQTAMEWVADYCDRSGRTLHLYGNGWEEHPRFAKYARGFAKNGEELRAIYQASSINLQITSYGAIHQRLLDGLAAGGFFLIRYCPTDTIREVTQTLLEVVEQYDIQTNMAYCAEDYPILTQAWRDLQELHGETGACDTVLIHPGELDRLRALAAGDFRLVARAVFDRYDDVVFRSADEFARMADHYLQDAETREEIANSMRKTVLERFTYDALVRDLLSFIHERLPTSEMNSRGQLGNVNPTAIGVQS
ncbi:MAG: glycosyltransferase family 1 protein [Planctomycetes bacterium]|nr:glycosyltransferase family 1 protein [Planctomycetota bacterium]